MNKYDITTLVRFNFWANEKLLAACETLPPDAFARPVTPDPGWGSLRGVLVHILDTEFGWRSILQAQDDGTILAEADFPAAAALKTRWEAEKTAWFEYLDSLPGADLEKGYGENPQNSPLVWQTILHVVTHGIQHRGEAAMLLTGYGCSPGELDFDLFLRL